MCGRYSLTLPLAELEEVLGYPAAGPLELRARYNVAPTQVAPVVAVGREGRARLITMKWGLVPPWADAPSMGARLINARAESVATRPAFREAFRRRRCLVPADGFYEWLPAGRGRPKRPFRLSRPDCTPLTFAGIWEAWRAERGAQPLLTYTILTTEANATVRPIHDRMPVIVPPADRARWLDADADPVRLADLFSSWAAGPLEAVEVSVRVNDPANDDPACIEPVEA